MDGDLAASPPAERTVQPGSWSLQVQAAVLRGSVGALLPLTPVPTELAKDEQPKRARWGYREQDAGVGELCPIQQVTRVMGLDPRPSGASVSSFALHFLQVPRAHATQDFAA